MMAWNNKHLNQEQLKCYIIQTEQMSLLNVLHETGLL